MTAFLFAFLLAQTAAAQNSGAVTGIVRGTDGKPAANVRVYATPARDTAQTTDPAALEGLTQTDAAGRYRLELPAGRYYIASGSVTVPTYYPGTQNISSARVIAVTAGGVVDSIDFGSFVPATRGGSFAASVVLGTAELTGTIRYPDGTPAAGIYVAVVPTTASIPTDTNGRYVISGLPAGSFAIAAGFSDAPVFYPGTTDLGTARQVVTTTTRVDNLDFVVPRPVGTIVSGRARSNRNGVAIRLVPAGSAAAPTGPIISSLPPRARTKEKVLDARGEFEFTDVVPGSYTVQAVHVGLPSQTQTLVVGAQPVRNLDFEYLVTTLSGRLVMADGSPVPNARDFDEVLAAAPGDTRTVPYSLAPDGAFSGLITNGEFRFLMRVLPEEYEVASVSVGGTALPTESVSVRADAPVDVEIRVRRQTEPSGNIEQRLAGVVIDSLSGQPAAAERVLLCCLRSGLRERLSAPLHADGTFQFANVPPGRYTPQLQVKSGEPDLYLGGKTVEVVDPKSRNVVLFAAQEFREVIAEVRFSDALPAGAQPRIVFVSTSGRVEIRASGNGPYRALVPAGDRYTVAVRDLPEEYVLKPPGGLLEVPRVTPRTATLPVVNITVGRKE